MMKPLTANLDILIILMGITVQTLASSPVNPRHQAKIQGRHHHHHRSLSLSRANRRDQTTTYYTDNWAGGVLLNSALPGTPSLTSVAATLTVPIATSTAQATDDTHIQAASAWVGIDGFVNTATAILQTGIDIVAYEGAETLYSAWYEWYPSGAVAFDLAIRAGDVLVLSVHSTADGEGGVATIQNQSTGKNVTAVMEGAEVSLTGQSVEWIVEDYQSDGQLVSLVDFEPVRFAAAVAGASGNLTFEVSDFTSAMALVDLVNVSEDWIVVEANIVGDGVTVMHV